MIWIVIAILIAAGVGWLGIAGHRYSVKLRAMRLVANALSEGQRDQIFGLIEQIGTGPSRGYHGLLKRTGEPNGQLAVALPHGLDDFPWGGMLVEAVAAPKGSERPVEFRIHEFRKSAEAADEATIQWLAVPSVSVGRKKRPQNVYSLDRYIRLSPTLAAMLTELYPDDPKLLLSELLSTDGRHHSSEPFDQLRCGLSAAWIQTPRFHKCPECRRPMRLILQVPGSLVAWRIAEGCFYFLGCPSHPDQTVTADDWG